MFEPLFSSYEPSEETDSYYEDDTLPSYLDYPSSRSSYYTENYLNPERRIEPYPFENDKPYYIMPYCKFFRYKYLINSEFKF